MGARVNDKFEQKILMLLTSFRKSQEFWELCARNQTETNIYIFPVTSHRENIRLAWQVVPESEEVKKPMGLCDVKHTRGHPKGQNWNNLSKMTGL